MKAFLLHRAVKEIFGVFLIAFSITTVISLVSHSPHDPSWNHAVSGSAHVKNLVGLGGSYLSDIMILLFGQGAFVLPVITLALGLLFFRNETFSFALSLLVGGAIFMFALCALLFIFSPSYPPYTETLGGGLLGLLVGEKFLIHFLARPGAAIAGFTLLLISILVSTRLSARQLMSFTKDFAIRIFTIFKTIVISALRFPLKIVKMVAKLARRLRPESSARSAGRGKRPVIVKSSDGKTSGKKGEDLPERQSFFNFMADAQNYSLPPLAYLDKPKAENREKNEKELLVNSQILEKKLADFGIEGRVVKVLPGPVITLYEFEPAAGIKVSRIMNLSDDLAMGLRAVSIRILAPVPGKAVVGIEVPNAQVTPVSLRQILVSERFADPSLKLPLALGSDTSGKPVVTDLSTIPHLLIAGATGSGKSVGLNSIITSLLFRASPAEVNFIMIDPKMLELSIYDGIPHLITPVVTNPKKAANALRWAVSEMERRYHLLANKGVRNIAGYNSWVREQLEEKPQYKKPKKEEPVTIRFDAGGVIEEEEEGDEEEELKPLPYIVVVIDELADLMMVASKDVEESLARLAQMARASGIHLILATQRPSVDVLTGLIKANFPARISYQVTSRIDSRTILDAIGAERLLGKGDMLFLPPGTSRLTRIHGPFVTDEEVKRVTQFLKKQGRPMYNKEILTAYAKAEESAGADEENDEYFEQAVGLIAQTRQASISMVQRRLRIGYNRAARIIEQMEAKGMVGPSDGAKPRQVLIPPLADDLP